MKAKKITAFIISVLMVFSVVPENVRANENDTPVSVLITEAPEVIEGQKYDSREHDLVKPGEAMGGTILYALGDDEVVDAPGRKVIHMMLIQTRYIWRLRLNLKISGIRYGSRISLMRITRAQPSSQFLSCISGT